MKKTKKSDRPAETARHREGTNIVLLDDDVAAALPNSEAVNKALREVLEAAPGRRSKRRRA